MMQGQKCRRPWVAARCHRTTFHSHPPPLPPWRRSCLRRTDVLHITCSMTIRYTNLLFLTYLLIFIEQFTGCCPWPGATMSQQVTKMVDRCHWNVIFRLAYRTCQRDSWQQRHLSIMALTIHTGLVAFVHSFIRSNIQSIYRWCDKWVRLWCQWCDQLGERIYVS